MYVVSLASLRHRALPWLRLLLIAGAVLGVLFATSRWFLPPRPAALPPPDDGTRGEASTVRAVAAARDAPSPVGSGAGEGRARAERIARTSLSGEGMNEAWITRLGPS